MSALAIISGIAGILFGIIVGYLVAAQQYAPSSAGTSVLPVAQAAPAPSAPIVNEQELQAYRDILKNDPRNVRAANELANRLYDANRYSEAIAYYQQAFALDPKNISISTDLGTALWYVGKADEALAQFDKSLALNAGHPQTLFNMGIVRSQGKNDHAGAVAAWEALLQQNPTYPDAVRVRQLIDESKARLGGQ
jgi:cytochrome c-type biogenesis protein CcmH/NrfG